jgi:predicted PurR-regulated permease PerM
MTIQPRRSTPPDDDVREPGPGEDQTRTETDAVVESEPFGRPGRPLDRRSPFFVGMTGAAGVAVTYGLIQLIIAARSVLILIGLALFIAAGLDPLVSWLTRHRLPRWAAVTVVVVGMLAAISGFLSAAIPPLASQATALANEEPPLSAHRAGPQLTARQTQ